MTARTALLGMLLFPLSVLSAPHLIQQAFLTATTARSMGYSVALSADGNTALVGAPYATITVSQQGAAYVYTRNGSTWTQQAVLTAPATGTGAAAANGSFGISVALSADGTTALIGSNLSPPSGAAPVIASYVFTRSGTTWSQAAYLAGGFFGSLSSDGKTALIVGGTTAFVYGQVASSIGFVWGFKATITLGSGPSIVYGAISGDASLIVLSSDSVYIYTGGGSVWSQQQVLTGPFGQGDVALSANGNTLLIGSPFDGSFPNLGAAYIFTRTSGQFTQQARIAPPTSAPAVGPGPNFGFSVALDPTGTAAIIGSPNSTVGANASQGAVYEYLESAGAWNFAQVLSNSGAMNDAFGWSVAAGGTPGSLTVLVGAESKTIAGNVEQGAAYVFVDVTAVVSGLINVIESLHLSPLLQSELIAIVGQIPTELASLTPAQTAATIGLLNFFIGTVKQAEAFRLMLPSAADQLVAIAGEIISALSGA